MGRTIDPNQLKYTYKLSTSFRQDATNADELTQEITEINENIAEMAQAIEELNSQLEEYVRTLNESIERFRQMLRPHVTEELNRVVYEHNDALHLISQDLERRNHENQDEISIRHPRENRTMGVFHNVNQQIRPQIYSEQPQVQGPNEEEFFKRAIRYVSNGVLNFIDLLVLSS